ncbi:hypothetical protein EDB84DRAFT_1446997 [Lactarius hengduanensis]|nr:hypothetical protein EDB84DRAFT_1446997 [Lactarius hengduanensis]
MGWDGMGMGMGLGGGDGDGDGDGDGEHRDGCVGEMGMGKRMGNVGVGVGRMGLGLENMGVGVGERGMGVGGMGMGNMGVGVGRWGWGTWMWVWVWVGWGQGTWVWGVGKMDGMGNMGIGEWEHGGMGGMRMGTETIMMEVDEHVLVKAVGVWSHSELFKDTLNSSEKLSTALDTYWFCRCGGQVGWGTEHGNMGAGVGGIGIENMGVDVGGMENGNIRAWAWVSDGECEYEGNMGLEMGNVEVGVGVGEMGKEIVCIGVGVRGMEKGDMSIGVQEMGKGNLHMGMGLYGCGGDGEDDISNADLEVLLTSIFWQATGTNVHFIWLQSTESEYQSRTHNRANMEQKKWSM